MKSFVDRLSVWAGLVKFSHTVFALPFALSMLIVVGRSRGVAFMEVLWILCAVASARTAAMAFNRVLDASIDAKNPRTANREIPSGRASLVEAALLTVFACAFFLVSAAALGSHCLVLAVPVLGVLLGYSYFKRFSALCHFVLGLALALAPGGVWYALTATWSWRPVPLMIAVLLWVAGFDILYSCQDIDFDRAEGLHSVPRYLGLERAMMLSALLHAATVPLLVLFGSEFELGSLYYVGVGVFAFLVASQHVAVRRKGLGCIDQVFFTRNGLASMVFFVFVIIASVGGR